jgi:hypothetical protein
MTEFRVTDLGPLVYFLGIKIERTREGMFLSQLSYLEKSLNRINMRDCYPCDTPLKLGEDLNAYNDQPCIVQEKPYKELIGCLMYVMLTTRPDLSVSVNLFSRYQSCATINHWEGLMHVLRYIKSTINLRLFYPKCNADVLCGYADASFADGEDRKSTSGYMFQVFDCLVSWNTKKQSVVARSTHESSELIALSEACSEYLWVNSILRDLFIHPQYPVSIFEDNQACIHSFKSVKRKG